MLADPSTPDGIERLAVTLMAAQYRNMRVEIHLPDDRRILTTTLWRYPLTKKFFLILTMFIPFAIYTTYVLVQVGYMGLIRDSTVNLSSIQVLLDLVIVCLLACLWMHRDAATCARNARPFIIRTLFGGSFGPMLYLLVGEFHQKKCHCLRSGAAGISPGYRPGR